MSHPQPSPAKTQAHGVTAAARARAYGVAVLCLCSFAVFFLTGVKPLPVLLYFPLSRRFGFQPLQGAGVAELSMDFYGRSLLALLAGLAAGLSTYAALQLFARPASRPPGRRLLLLTTYAMTAFALAVSLFAYQLAMRAPTPLPLPAGAADQAEPR